MREWSSHADQGMSEVGGSVADAVAGCCTLLEDGGCPLCITGRAGIVDGIAPSIGGPAARTGCRDQCQGVTMNC